MQYFYLPPSHLLLSPHPCLVLVSVGPSRADTSRYSTRRNCGALVSLTLLIFGTRLGFPPHRSHLGVVSLSDRSCSHPLPRGPCTHLHCCSRFPWWWESEFRTPVALFFRFGRHWPVGIHGTLFRRSVMSSFAQSHDPHPISPLWFAGVSGPVGAASRYSPTGVGMPPGTPIRRSLPFWSVLFRFRAPRSLHRPPFFVPSCLLRAGE